MTPTDQPPLPARASGTFAIGGTQVVHRMGYGSMQLPGPGVWGPSPDPENAVAVLRRAVDLGVDLIDTADSYGPGVAEDLIREALHPYDGLTIATKAGLLRTGPDDWYPLGHPKYLRQCAEMSLRRLGVERLDLFQLHRIDRHVPLADQLGVLVDLQDEGKVAHIGLSEVTVEQIEAARQIATITTVQNEYNVVKRASQDVLEHCQAHGIGFIPWFPMATGALARPGGALAQLALASGHTPAQLALAWLLHRSPVLLAIPGTRSLAHLEQNIAAAGITLDEPTYAALTAVAG